MTAESPVLLAVSWIIEVTVHTRPRAGSYVGVAVSHRIGTPRLARTLRSPGGICSAMDSWVRVNARNDPPMALFFASVRSLVSVLARLRCVADSGD